jgi:DNA repair exonuclease SbcCD ATPase subunit
LDDEQKKYWMSEVKRYRAHLSTALESEREAAISSYNQMMNQFDNAAKEVEAERIRKRQKMQDFQTAKTKQFERRGKLQKNTQANMKHRTELMTKKRQIIQDIFEAEANQSLTDSEREAFTAELQGIADELQIVNAILNEGKVPKPKSDVTKVEDTTQAEGESPKVVRKKMPKAGKTIVKTAMHKGNKVLIYSDGSKAYADEVE